AAKNPAGGLAAGGLGVGMGYAMANQIGQNLSNAQTAAAAPPPLPTDAQYHVAISGQQAGPFDLAALKEKVTAGQITRQTLVWKQGMQQWAAAGNMVELASLFANVPPPIPQT